MFIRKFKLALSPMHRILLNFGNNCILSLSKFDNKEYMGFTAPFLKYKYLKLKLRVFSVYRTSAIATQIVLFYR